MTILVGPIISKVIENTENLSFLSSILALGIFFLLLFFVGIYIYYALVWMTIAKKLKYGKPWLAWIPIANFFLLPILAKKHWALGFLIFVPIVNIIFCIIWKWKIYERRNYPGELSLLQLLGFVPFLFVVVLVLEGFIAWYDKNEKRK